MRLLPRTRRWRLVLGVVAVAVVATSPRWFPAAELAFNQVVPGPAFSAAADRTSEPADAVVDIEGIEVTEAAPAGDDPPELVAELVVELASPTSVADPHGPGPVLVSMREGRIVAVDLDDGATDLLADLTDRTSTGGERGLLSIVLGPDGDRLYANLTDTDGDNRIVSWPFDVGKGSSPVLDLDLDNEVEHLRIGQPFPNHNGGNLVFGPDDALWIGTGDGGGVGDPDDSAQDPGTVLGKMLRVVPLDAGGVAAVEGNRFVNDEARDGGRPEIWAVGLRNPWRYSFDRATGMLWLADVGQNSVEEVNAVDPAEDGVNFGWNVVEGSNDYEGEPRPELTAPVVEYGHDEGCSVTGGYVYRGDDLVGLDGWYLFSDYCSGWVRAVPADDPDQEPLELADGLGQVIAFGELNDGELLVATTDGLHSLAPAASGASEPFG